MNLNSDKLTHAWGHQAVSFDKNWFDLSQLPTDLSEIDSLLRKMPPDRVFVRVTSTDPSNTNIERLSLDEVPDLVSRLENGESTIHLQAIHLEEHLSVYQSFMYNFIQKVSESVPGFHRNNLISSSVGLFVSTPGATAPFHADPEHNFLIQVLGEKTMHSFPPKDFETFPSKAREKLASQKISMLETYTTEFENRATVLHLNEGDMVYHPPMSPHWVKTSEQGFSLSYSLSLVSKDVENTMLLHKVNYKLRKMGFNPKDEGESPFSDRIKVKSAACGKALKKVFS